MTLADEKKKKSSERWTLVRVSGRRNPSASFTALGGDIYVTTWPSDNSVPYTVWYNDEAEFTKVTTVTNDGEWSFDEATRQLKVKTVGAVPNVDYYALVSYYLFYSSYGHGDVSYYENPDDSATSIRSWRSLLDSDPSFSTGFSEILNGVFTIANTSISIQNVDSDFQRYIGNLDSFYRQPVSCWVFVNGEKQKTYVGQIASVQIGDIVQFNILDSFTRLDDDAMMGDIGVSAKMSTSAAPNDIGKPIPLIMARESFSQKDDQKATYTGSTEAGEWLDGMEAKCALYTPNQQFALYNRSWTLCRTLAPIQSQSFGAVVRGLVVDSISVAFKFASYSNVRVGDTLKWKQAGTDYWGRIVAVGNLIYSGNSYDIRVIESSGFPAASNTSTVTALKCLSCWAEGMAGLDAYKTQYGFNYLHQDLEYSLGQITLPSGHTKVFVTVVDNWESMQGLTEILDPTKNKLKFSLRTQTVDLNHATNLKRIIAAAGISTDDATFTQAAIDLVEDTNFMIPNIDETEFSSYRKYVTDLLQGTLGYLRTNSEGQAQYYLLNAPVSGSTKDDSVISSDDVSIELEYQDMITRITPSNIHLPIIGTRSVTQHSNSDSELLHGIRKEIDFPHYMAAQDPSRITEILYLKSNRRVKYSYKTAIDDIDSILGDDVTIKSPKILGGSGSVDAKIIDIDKSVDETTVTTSDLLGL